ncbi:SusE domain-containing protein [uncultured Bacteroides sp.]|uniref:SusE domain-containing protein n=1 Tax=uncultured Bacteroides sp. TaxID=162156 RepID=UPI00262E6131|nr:SusE domain-containing protein [uncultured Bacteroides sp.]
MRKIYSLFTFVIGMMLLGSCSDDKEPVFSSSNAVPGTLSSIDDSYVLSAESSEFATFTFTETDFGLQVAKRYELETSLQEDFTVLKQLGTLVTTGKGGSLAVAAETMNSTLLGWEAETGEATTVFFRIKTVVTDASSQATDISVYSNVISSLVTPYSGERVYPKIYVIGDYSAWGWDTAQSLFSFSADEVNYEGIVDFSDKAINGFKLTGDKSWETTTGNWGPQGDFTEPMESADVQLINDGGSGNVKCYNHRFYRFSFNKTSLLLHVSQSFDGFYLVGSDSGIGWDTATGRQMNFDSATQRFYLDYTFGADAEIKFLTDTNVWFGGDAEGGLNTQDNIKVAAGSYRIYVNLNNSTNQTYELNANDFEAAE